MLFPPSPVYGYTHYTRPFGALKAITSGMGGVPQFPIHRGYGRLKETPTAPFRYVFFQSVILIPFFEAVIVAK
jgi:hypothetical protein